MTRPAASHTTEWSTHPVPARDRREITPLAASAMRFLDSKMYATSAQIGHHLGASPSGGTNYIAIGAKVAGDLRKRGFAARLEDGLWRITAKGRDALTMIDTPPAAPVRTEE